MLLHSRIRFTAFRPFISVITSIAIAVVHIYYKTRKQLIVVPEFRWLNLLTQTVAQEAQ